MSKKVFALISGIVGALQTAGVAIVTYMSPENATAKVTFEEDHPPGDTPRAGRSLSETVNRQKQSCDGK